MPRAAPSGKEDCSKTVRGAKDLPSLAVVTIFVYLQELKLLAKQPASLPAMVSIFLLFV